MVTLLSLACIQLNQQAHLELWTPFEGPSALLNWLRYPTELQKCMHLYKLWNSQHLVELQILTNKIVPPFRQTMIVLQAMKACLQNLIQSEKVERIWSRNWKVGSFLLLHFLFPDIFVFCLNKCTKQNNKIFIQTQVRRATAQGFKKNLHLPCT